VAANFSALNNNYYLLAYTSIFAIKESRFASRKLLKSRRHPWLSARIAGYLQQQGECFGSTAVGISQLTGIAR